MLTMANRIRRIGSLTGRLARDAAAERLRGRSSGFGTRERVSARVRQAEHIVKTLGQMKGAAMKVGQSLALLADQLDLPEDVRQVLGQLHSEGEPIPFPQIKASLDRELGADAFAHIHPEPLGSASLAQAHLATLPDGREVVVKVLHDGIEDDVRADLMALKAIVRSGRLLGRGKDELNDLFEELEIHLIQELDYLQEAANIHAFHQAFAGDSRVTVPQLHTPCCTERVLTMDRVPGMSLDRFVKTATPEARQHAGTVLADLFFEMTFRHRLLHADPHPGNYLFTEDGQVSLLDFGCVKRFNEFFVGRYAQLVLSALDGDREGALEAARDLGSWTGEDPAAADAIWEFCDVLVAPWRSGTYRIGGADDALVERLEPVARRMWTFREIRGPRDVLFLHRTLGGLYSIARQLEVEDDWGARMRPHLEYAIAKAKGESL